MSQVGYAGGRSRRQVHARTSYTVGVADVHTSSTMAVGQYCSVTLFVTVTKRSVVRLEGCTSSDGSDGWYGVFSRELTDNETITTTVDTHGYPYIRMTVVQHADAVTSCTLVYRITGNLEAGLGEDLDVFHNPIHLNTDSFGRLCTTNATTLGMSMNGQPFRSSQWQSVVTGTGATTSNGSDGYFEVRIDDNSSSATMISRMEYTYIPLNTLRIGISVVLSPTEDTGNCGIIKWGAYNGEDGSLFCYNRATNALWVEEYRGGVLRESVQQADWNMDVFDGTGHSGMAVPTNGQGILVSAIEYGYLGGENTVMLFYKNHRKLPVHMFQHGHMTTPYFKTAKFPVHFSITGDETSADGITTARLGCYGIQTEGNMSSVGHRFSASVPFGSYVSVPQDTPTPVLAVRLNTSLAYRSFAILQSFTIAVNSGAALVGYQLVRCSALNNATWSDVDATTPSVMQYSTDATSISGNYTVITQGALEKKSSSELSRSLQDGYANFSINRMASSGDSEIIVILACGIAGTGNSNIWACIDGDEI